jgi:hypothetical protein
LTSKSCGEGPDQADGLRGAERGVALGEALLDLAEGVPNHTP